MTLGAILVMAVGVAMDATAVAAARGLAASRVRPRDVLAIGLLFGGAQALMPLLGFALGARVGAYVAAWDHWIAFGVLAVLGLRMIREAGAEPETPREPFALRMLLLLSLATSIDALAVGLTLPLLGAPLLTSIAAMGLTTAVLSMAGVFAGRRFGAALGPRLDVVGGILLIAVGSSILVEHLR